jgi:6-phosphogluconolactonase (cycloisomerase 2 family)
MTDPTPDTARASFGLAFVGAFTTPERLARGRGIEICRIDPASGAWSVIGRCEGLDNPSFLLTDPGRRTLYAVHGDRDYASAFAVDPHSGALRPLGRAATGGMNGVHLAIDPTGRFLIVANFAGGSLAALPIRDDGSLADAVHRLDLAGPPGPHRLEQTSPHPHHLVFDPTGRFLLAPDKGLDRVFVLTFDAERGRLSLADQGHAVMRPGSGPRHIAFHPSAPLAFVVGELDSTVTACRWDGKVGVLTPLWVVSSLPPDFLGETIASAIVVSPDGASVYASNRGQDRIVHLRVDPNAGRLEVVGWTPSEGAIPRFMTLSPDGRRLFVANEQGDSIVAFDTTWPDGELVSRGAVLRTPSPSAIAFL